MTTIPEVPRTTTTTKIDKENDTQAHTHTGPFNSNTLKTSTTKKNKKI